MKIYATFTLVILGLVLFADQGFAYEPYKSDWTFRYGEKLYTQQYYMIANKNGIQNAIRFTCFNFFPRNWSDHNLLSNSLPRHIKSRSNCHVAEDYRFQTLAKDNPSILVFAWLNQSANYIGWAAVKHSYDGWYITSNQRFQWYPMEGYSVGDEIEFEWLYNGVPIKIYIRNPRDENGWTENDIWYRFSYQ